MNLVSAHNGLSWNLVVVYGPCSGEHRDNFIQWLYDGVDHTFAGIPQEEGMM